MTTTSFSQYSACFLIVAAMSCGSEPPAPATGVEAPEAAATEAGTSEAGSPSLPANFPADFPLPPDFELQEARFVEGDAMTQANHLVRGASRIKVAELESFYRERLPDAGYDLGASQPSANPDHALVYFSGDEFRDCSIQLNGSGEITNVLINLPLRD